MFAVARRLRALVHDEQGGQVAFGFMLLMVAVFMFFALAVDTGIWALDHRSAQNQVDAAAHAGALAVSMGLDPETEMREVLAGNGVADPDANVCPGDSEWYRVVGERVEVCQRRTSEAVFARLTGVLEVWVSARAAAETTMHGIALVE